MRKLTTLIAATALLLAACGDSGPASCADYAADLQRKAAGLSPQQVSDYIDETAEDVARLIADEPEKAQACADAVIDALIGAGLDGSNGGFED